MSSQLSLVVAMLGLLILAGCGASSTPTPPPTPTATPTADTLSNGGATTQASIQNFAHQDLTVQVGGTVVWTQRDSTTHTTTSGTPGNPEGIWDSGVLSQNQTFSRTFTQPGTFLYFCSLHSSMTATITVTDASSTDTTSPPTTSSTGRATYVRKGSADRRCKSAPTC